MAIGDRRKEVGRDFDRFFPKERVKPTAPTGGTNRVQTADVGSQPTTRRGASGGKKNLTTKKAIQTGGAGDGLGVKSAMRKEAAASRDFMADIAGGTGVPSAGRSRFSSILRTGKRSTGAIEDPTDIASQLPQQTTRPIRVEAIDSIKNKKFASIGGTKRPSTKTANGIEGGGFVDQGSFKKGGKTLRELSKQGKRVSPFSEKGIEQLFGSAADLAKLFTSKEFQSRKAKGIQSAAGVKGRRVDAKAKTDKIKALSGVLEDLSASGGDNEGLMASIQEQLQNLISGNDGDGMSGEVIARLADQFEPDQVKTILGIMQ